MHHAGMAADNKFGAQMLPIHLTNGFPYSIKAIYYIMYQDYYYTVMLRGLKESPYQGGIQCPQ